MKQVLLGVGRGVELFCYLLLGAHFGVVKGALIAAAIWSVILLLTLAALGAVGLYEEREAT